MKKLLLGALLLLSMIGFSQNDTVKNNLPTLESYLYKVDKFSGEKTYYSFGQISVSKYIKNGVSSQYISISVYDDSLYTGNGLFILFDNGQKIIRNNDKIDYNVNSGSGGGFRYSAFFTPTKNEIDLFKTRKVVAVKLYLFDSDISTKDSDAFQTASKVLLK